MSRQVEERRIQGDERPRSEMDDVRGAISARLKLGGPPRMSDGAKEKPVRSEEAESFPCTEKRERRIYLSRREINDVRDKEREEERK